MLKTLCSEMLCIIVKKHYAVKCCVLLLTTLRSEMMCINAKNTTQRNVYECYTPNAVKCCILMLKNYAVKCI